MTDLFEKALAVATALPPAQQDEVARMVLAYAGREDEADVIRLTPAEEADLLEARAEMERGEFATDSEVEAVLSKYRA